MKFKRFVSGLLCAIILVGILPTTSSAVVSSVSPAKKSDLAFTIPMAWCMDLDWNAAKLYYFMFANLEDAKAEVKFGNADTERFDVSGSAGVEVADGTYYLGWYYNGSGAFSDTRHGGRITGIPHPSSSVHRANSQDGKVVYNTTSMSTAHNSLQGEYLQKGLWALATEVYETLDTESMSAQELYDTVSSIVQNTKVNYIQDDGAWGSGENQVENAVVNTTSLKDYILAAYESQCVTTSQIYASLLPDADGDGYSGDNYMRVAYAVAGAVATMTATSSDGTVNHNEPVSDEYPMLKVPIDVTGQFGTYLKTAEERERELAASEDEFINSVPVDTDNMWECLRAVGAYYTALKASGSTQSISQVLSAGAPSNAAQNIKDAWPKVQEFYASNRSSIDGETPPVARMNALDFYAWACFHPDEIKGRISTEASDLSYTSRPIYAAQVIAARDELKALTESDPHALSSTDPIDMAQTWVLKFWVSYGVAEGLLPLSDLDYLPDTPSAVGTRMAAIPPYDMFYKDGDDVKVATAAGAIKFYSVVNELPYIVNGMVAFLAQRLSDGTSGSYSFVGLQDKLIGIRDVYETFTTVNSDALWDFWDSTVFDNESGEGEKKSMRMIYEVLLANNVFDRTDVESEPNAEQAFTFFFDHQSSELSSWIRTGISASAQFIPMRTNVYDPYTWKDIVDTGWLLNFYAKFGYFRKALYIDTAAEAASNYANTRGKGTTRVATLDDLLQEKDIVLYIDPNLYNVDDIADLMGKAWDRLGQDAASNSLGVFESFGAAITNLWDVSMPELAKSGGTTSYSSRVNFTGEEGDESKWSETFFHHDGTAKLSSYEDVDAQTTIDPNSRNVADYLYRDDIYDQNAGALKEDYQAVEYTPLFGYAVLSAVYNQKAAPGLLQALNSLSSSNNPVFIASDTIPYTHEEFRSTIYNWALLRNLEAQMTTDYATSLDRTSPLYMDVFGNIVTESGYVVVPAAANATLYDVKDYQPRTAAFCSTYGDSYFIPYYDTESAEKLNNYLKGNSDYSMFSVDEKNSVFVMKTVTTVDGTVDLSRVSIADKTSLQALSDTFTVDLSKRAFYKFSLFELIITETLRGAPIEFIDKQFEGIQTNVTYTRQGLIVADKLETLVDAIAPAGQNASVAIPNPAYIDGLEYIIFFLYKVLILAVLVLWMVTIYFDATRGAIGVKTAGRCVGIVVLVLAMVVGIPRIFEITYYESNKLLLQNETEYLMMLNLEKQANGEEIGVSRVDVPDPRTKLYLYLADVEMPWWDLFTSVTVSSSIKSLDEMYSNYENQHPLAFVEDATVMNGRIYIDTDTLFESAKVAFSPVLQSIYVTGTEDTPASYYTPYYYFLDTITKEISAWSNRNDFIAYTTKTQRGGELKTMGYCQAFFNDASFLEEGSDFFNLYEVYAAPAPRTYEFLPELTQEELDNLRNSQWCNVDISVKGKVDRIERLNQFAQEWIANNRGMIGRVSDETFLKCFSLACAMEHNRLFNTQRADYLEIQELSNEDLLRLTIADHNDVMANSSMSYARFVYTQGGTMAVYVAAILEIVNFIGSWVKPAVTLAVFLIACISIFVLKLMLNRGNNSIYGYVVTIVLMCSVNVLGALFIKLSMFIPTLGFTPTVCMLAQILVQIGYIFLQIKIVTIALSDWKNIGFSKHESMFMRMNPVTRRHNVSREVGVTPGTSGHAYLDALLKQQAKRRMRA